VLPPIHSTNQSICLPPNLLPVQSVYCPICLLLTPLTTHNFYNSICLPPNLLTNPLLNKIRKQTMTPFHQFIKYLNLSLVVVFPIAWLSPLLTTDLLPQWHMPVWLGGNTLFEPNTLTVITNIQSPINQTLLVAEICSRLYKCAHSSR
jgi:hypothetical protein